MHDNLSLVWIARDRAITLGPEVGRGGEARVFDMGNLLAKVYRPEVLRDAPRRQALAAKVACMCEKVALQRDSRFAWPLAPVFLDSQCREWIGFLMRRCPGVGMEVLGTLRTVQEFLPQWNRLTIAQTMERVVAAAEFLENAGVMVGDVAPANFRVDAGGCIYFLDTDSFQLREGGKLHRCPVLTPRYAPPELLLSGACDAERTTWHLRFSIAVLLFECLTIGVHPYQRTWGEDPIANLKLGKTAIGGSRATAWLPPVLWERYAALHPAVKRCCVLAFQDGHGNPHARPSLAMWRQALRLHVGWLQQGTAA